MLGIIAVNVMGMSSMIYYVLGIIFIGLISCIYNYVNGTVDAISSMFAAIQ